MGLRDLVGRLILGRDRYDLVHFSKEWEEFFGGAGTASATGIRITWQKALQVTTALCCASIIAEGICSIPFKLYRKEGKSRVEARDHPLWDVIHASPNEWQTSFEFRETLGLHLALCGNAFVFVNRVRGNVRELIPLEPGHVSVERKPDWTLEYTVSFPDGSTHVMPSGMIWHLRSRSWDSYRGLETIALARDALGLSLAIENSQAKMHKDGVRPSGVLSLEQSLDDTQFAKYRKLIDLQYSGRLNAGKPMILDKGAKWMQLAMSGVDAETLATRGFQIEEVARAMRVLPIMIGYSGDKSMTYASAEQMFIQHHRSTTRVWHRRIEQSADKWLLKNSERAAGYYTGFVDNELLRGDTKVRGEFYRLLWMIGAVTGNEIRRMEEMDDLPGLDRPWAPLNSAPIDEDGRPMVPDSVVGEAREAVAAVLRKHGIEPALLPSPDDPTGN